MVQRTNARRGALLAVLALPLVASGCGSSEPKDDGVIKPAPAKAADDKPIAKPAEPEQLESITIKKGDKKNPEAAYLDKPDPGNVSIDFKNVDLARVALPLFSKQSGVIVEYGGPPKNVSSLRLVNAPWRDALDYICRFTQTHCVASQVRGRIELKLGYSDSKPFLDKFDPNRRDVELSGGADAAAEARLTGIQANRGGGSAGGGSTGGGATGASSGGSSSTSPEPGSGEIEDPNAKGKAQMERLRTGVSTQNSGN